MVKVNNMLHQRVFGFFYDKGVVDTGIQNIIG